MTETKKTYPSQIASKAIAARIPAADYVQFLNDAISKGITLNDWLLTKIYSNTSKNSQISGISDSDISLLNYLKENFEIIETDDNLWSIASEEYGVHIYDTNQLNRYLKTIFDPPKKEPNLLDAKTQISIIAKNKLKNNKDFKEFFDDLNDLLSEIE